MPSFTHDLIQAVKLPNVETFIETGTYHGNTLQNVLTHFKNIYSVELSQERFYVCKQRFQSQTHVHLFNTTSKQFLQLLCPLLQNRSIFFLDAHYDGIGSDSAVADVWIPISDELDAIALSPIKNHVIIIDDMCCMDNSHYDKNSQKWAGAPGIHVVLDKIQDIHPDYRFYVFAESDKLIASTTTLDLSYLRPIRNECPWGDIDPSHRGKRPMTKQDTLALLEPFRKKEIIKILQEVVQHPSPPEDLQEMSFQDLWKLKISSSHM
jgi:hypothetical protein